MKEAILEAVRQRIVEIEEVHFVPTGRLKGAEHLIGCFDGPDDLSTNPSHMEGYGS